MAAINRLNPGQKIGVKAGRLTFAGKYTGVILSSPRSLFDLDYLTLEIHGDVAVLDSQGRKIIGTKPGFKTQHIPLINVTEITK